MKFFVVAGGELDTPEDGVGMSYGEHYELSSTIEIECDELDGRSEKLPNWPVKGSPS
jgi:hypothetical protein